MEFLTVAGRRLECEWVGVPDASAGTLVFLHQGLGTLALWRDFAALVATRSGCRGFLYSRCGHGGSDPLLGPYGPRFMHDEALVVLPEVLERAGIDRPVLVGHSDGGEGRMQPAHTGFEVAHRLSAVRIVEVDAADVAVMRKEQPGAEYQASVRGGAAPEVRQIVRVERTPIVDVERAARRDIDGLGAQGKGERAAKGHQQCQQLGRVRIERQHDLARSANLLSVSRGKEPHRRVRIFRADV